MAEHLHIRPVPDELVTRHELARLMRVSIATVDRRIHDGMPVVRFSPGTVRINPQQAMAWCADKYNRDRKAA